MVFHFGDHAGCASLPRCAVGHGAGENRLIDERVSKFIEVVMLKLVVFQGEFQVAGVESVLSCDAPELSFLDGAFPDNQNACWCEIRVARFVYQIAHAEQIEELPQVAAPVCFRESGEEIVVYAFHDGILKIEDLVCA